MNYLDHLSETFFSMIFGVSSSDSLTETEKTYIIEMLSEQLQIEQQTAHLLEPT